jgi:hypothetical protein
VLKRGLKMVAKKLPIPLAGEYKDLKYFDKDLRQVVLSAKQKKEDKEEKSILSKFTPQKQKRH